MCFSGRETQVSSDMCFPGGGTRITRDMHFPGRGTQVIGDICSRVEEHISLAICVSLPGKHISLDISDSHEREHI